MKDTDTYEITVAAEVVWSEVTNYDRALENYGRICARENNNAGKREVALWEGLGDQPPIKEEQCGFTGEA